MITARRENNYGSFNEERGNVAVMEREVASTEEKKPTRQESIDEVRERMKKNLAMILNYDKPEAVVEEPVKEVEKKVEVVNNVKDDDIRPTTTTMQFGDGDVNQMFNELKKEETKAHAVSGKTKFALVLYALAVTVILALIIINTGVLSLIKGKSELKQSELSDAISEYNRVNEELSLHGDDYVESVAEDIGMVK
ncbi:MAG: hypothetical protein SPL13_04745 [Clostridia bacterium]|nr:hypothetical protein [Clostridia bacterium]